MFDHPLIVSVGPNVRLQPPPRREATRAPQASEAGLRRSAARRGWASACHGHQPSRKPTTVVATPATNAQARKRDTRGANQDEVEGCRGEAKLRLAIAQTTPTTDSMKARKTPTGMLDEPR